MAGEDVILNDQNVIDYEHEVRYESACGLRIRLSLLLYHMSLPIEPVAGSGICLQSVFLISVHLLVSISCGM